MKQCPRCGRPILAYTVCICNYKQIGTWGPWTASTKPAEPLTPWQVKKNIRQIKCQAAVNAARRRVQEDEEHFLGGQEKYDHE